MQGSQAAALGEVRVQRDGLDAQLLQQQRQQRAAPAHIICHLGFWRGSLSLHQRSPYLGTADRATTSPGCVLHSRCAQSTAAQD